MPQPKLYIFAIGGTGARTIKALTMLLASGIKINASEIIPILIDPHVNNEDQKRTQKMIDDYRAIQARLGGAQNGFFSTPIRTLKEISGDAVMKNQSFMFDLENVATKHFRDYIDFDSLGNNNKALAELLFSEDNLNTKMDIGFVGNPNIGSVVLNQIEESAEFKTFASTFQENDRVFIISSIFGGTGAAGFPLILKNIRNSTNEWLKNAKIGAVSVQPYFGVGEGDGKVDKATFISKTKAALNYYEKNLNLSLDALYAIGDTLTKDYANDPGAGGQQNDAHFMEMVAALSIHDFMQYEDADLSKSCFREFGIRSDANKLHFQDLGVLTQNILKKHLTQYYYFIQYINTHLDADIRANAPYTTNTQIFDAAFLTTPFFTSKLKDINTAFLVWLREMEGNNRAFAPFNLDTNDFAAMIVDIETKKGFLGKKTVTSADYKDALNTAVKKLPKDDLGSKERKLISLFAAATDALLKDKFDYFHN